MLRDARSRRRVQLLLELMGILHVYSISGMKGQFWYPNLRGREGEGTPPPRFDSVENTDIEKVESNGRL